MPRPTCVVFRMTPTVTPNREGPTEREPKEGIPELRDSSVSDVPQNSRQMCVPDVRQNRRKHIVLRGVLKNPSVESVSGEQTQLSPKDFLLSFTRACLLPGIIYFLADVMCRFRTRNQMFACGGLAVAWGWSSGFASMLRSYNFVA